MNSKHLIPSTTECTHDRSQALPLALIALAVGTILASVFVMAISIYLRLTSVAASDLLDYYTADAGIEQALAPLVADPLAYPSAASLSVSLNNRAATVGVTLLGSQVVAEPRASVTTTVATYLVTSQTSAVTIRARAEARKVFGQASGSVRIIAWGVGQ